jgi:WD40 repeat protein
VRLFGVAAAAITMAFLAIFSAVQWVNASTQKDIAKALVDKLGVTQESLENRGLLLDQKEHELMAKNEEVKLSNENLNEKQYEIDLKNIDIDVKVKKILAQNHDLTVQKNRLNKSEILAKAKTDEANEERARAAELFKDAEEKQLAVNRLLYAGRMRMANEFYQRGDFRLFEKNIDDTDSERRGIEWNLLKHRSQGIMQFENYKEFGFISLDFTFDGRYLITKDLAGVLSRWDIRTGQREEMERGHPTYSLSPNGRWLATCVNRKQLDIWNLNESQWSKTTFADFTDRDCGILKFNESNELVLKNMDFSTNEMRYEMVNILTKARQEDRFQLPLNVNWNTYKDLPKGDKILETSEFNKRRLYIRHSDGREIEIDEEINERIDDYDIAVSPRRIVTLKRYKNADSSQTERNFSFVVFDLDKDRTERTEKLPIPEIASDFNDDVALSPDGSRFAVLYDNCIQILDLTTNKTIHLIRGAFSGRVSMAFSPDSTEIAVANESPSNKSPISLWKVDQDDDIFDFEGNRPIGLSSDGSRVIGRNSDGEWVLWDTVNRRKIRNLELHARLAEADASQKLHIASSFSKKDKFFYAWVLSPPDNDTSSGLQIWNAETGKEIILDVSGLCKYRANPAFTRDSETEVAVMCADGKLKIWDSQTGSQKNEFDTKIENALQLLYENDNRDLTVRNSSFDLLRFDATTGKEKEIETIPDLEKWSSLSPWMVKISPNEDYFLEDNLGNRKQLELSARDYDSRQFEFSRDGKQVAGYVSKDVEHGPFVKAEGVIVNLTTLNRTILDGLTGRETKGIFIKFSPLGKWLIGTEIKEDNSEMYLWNSETGKRYVFRTCTENPTFSQDESRLITSCFKGTLKFWDILSEQEILSLNVGDTKIDSIVLLENDNQMIIGTKKGYKHWKIKF